MITEVQREAEAHQQGEIVAWVDEGIGLVSHACNGSKFRRISLREIRQTLEAPDTVNVAKTPPGLSQRYRSIRFFGSRRIKVVWVLEDGVQVVISCADKDMDDE